jgi:hypothetical protein
VGVSSLTEGEHLSETNPNGRYFVSYRRRDIRMNELDRLRLSFRLHGIPTWLDRTDLRLRPTERELERIIHDRETAGALLYMTPEIEADEKGEPSAIIRQLEVPEILKRARYDTGFLTILIVGGGLDYADVDRVYGKDVALANLPDLNMLKVSEPEMTQDDAVSLSRRILAERLETIQNILPSDQPLLLTLDTRGLPGFRPDVAVALDWSNRFEGRHCPDTVWRTELAPSLSAVRAAIQSRTRNRRVIASGLLSLPAALLLGLVFSKTQNVTLSWLQRTDGDEHLWDQSIREEAARRPSSSIERRDLAARDLLLMVSVTQDVSPDVNTMLSRIPGIRVVVRIDWEGFGVMTPGEAVEAAGIVRDALVEARQLGADGTLHVFLAVPAGLAVLIGQNLNTFLPIQAYEHDRDLVPAYRPAYLLHEGDLCVG